MIRVGLTWSHCYCFGAEHLSLHLLWIHLACCIRLYFTAVLYDITYNALRNIFSYSSYVIFQNQTHTLFSAVKQEKKKIYISDKWSRHIYVGFIHSVMDCDDTQMLNSKGFIMCSVLHNHVRPLDKAGVINLIFRVITAGFGGKYLSYWFFCL